MIPGQEEAVEIVAQALIPAWEKCGLLRWGGFKEYTPAQQDRLMADARFQARALLGAFKPKLTSAELTKALA